MSHTALGFLLLVLAGVANANFATPMKFTRRWAWENTWLAWTLFALLVLPLTVTLLSVPHLADVYQGHSALLWNIGLYGAGWGVAQVFFGLAVESIGIALTFSIVMGISAAVGSLIPMLRLHPGQINTSAGHQLLAGVGLMLVGVAFCAWAGRKREHALRLDAADPVRGHTTGLVLAILCGLGASLVNFGLAFGGPIIRAAESRGAYPLNAVNAVWLPVMLAGAIPNLIYCFYRLRLNHTAVRFKQGGISHWLLALLMAIFWFGSTLLYGLSTLELGAWGPILGWPLFMSFIVITASVVGIATGEWKKSGRAPLLLQFTGVALLIAAVFILTTTSRYFS
jgi:L-rhamnose-H+ transport protein